MSNNFFSGSPAIRRFAATAAAALITLTTAAYFAVRAPKTGLAPTGSVQILHLENGSGAQVAACYDNGRCNFSGSLMTQGVLVNTGALTTWTRNAGIVSLVTAADNVGVGTATPKGKFSVAGSGSFTKGLSGSVIRADTELRSSGSLNITGTVSISSGVLIRRPTDIGWRVVAGANTACNTTCTFACVFGEDTSVLGSFVSCDDATADRCLCAGSN